MIPLSITSSSSGSPCSFVESLLILTQTKKRTGLHSPDSLGLAMYLNAPNDIIFVRSPFLYFYTPGSSLFKPWVKFPTEGFPQVVFIQDSFDRSVISQLAFYFHKSERYTPVLLPSIPLLPHLRCNGPKRWVHIQTLFLVKTTATTSFFTALALNRPNSSTQYRRQTLSQYSTLCRLCHQTFGDTPRVKTP